MVTMETIQPPSAFSQIIVKLWSEITEFQMLPETTIFNFKILNFARSDLSFSISKIKLLWGGRARF